VKSEMTNEVSVKTIGIVVKVEEIDGVAFVFYKIVNDVETEVGDVICVGLPLQSLLEIIEEYRKKKGEKKKEVRRYIA